MNANTSTDTTTAAAGQKLEGKVAVITGATRNLARAAFFAMQEAARHMADGGRVVNIGTTLLGATTGMYSAYAGSKAPLEDFSRALAREIGARGITVNVVAPGALDTAFFYGAGET